MNTYYTKFIYLLVLLGVSYFGHSQSDLKIFNEPTFAVNHRVSKTYRMHFAFKGRHFIYTDDGLYFKQRQLELGHFSTLTLNSRHSISLGVLYRNRNWFEDSGNEFRTTLQFNIKSPLSPLRFGQRIRVEQRFFEHITAHRLRYRLAIDIPLNGEKLDVGEAYLVSSTEFLWSLSRSIPQLDNRTTVHLGWYANKSLKLQLGLEHQLIRFNKSAVSNIYLLPSVVYSL